jgi:ppGpp synthetase/RelA/SpoT-type nucleotidyltranferase
VNAADLAALYAERFDLLAAASITLETRLAEQLAGLPHIDRVSFRAKGADSFLTKVTEAHADNPYAEPLLEVEDQVAGRVLVLFADDEDAVTQAATQLFNPVEAIRHAPTKDAEFGYESFHSVFSIPDWALPEGWSARDDLPTMFELQIRTLFQHAYAEPQHDLGYKPSAPLTSNEKRELAWIAAGAWGADQALVRVRKQLDERNA